MTETATKTYELAYHLIPDLDDQTVTKNSEDIQNLISQYGGYIVATHAPQKRHLSYPIQHHRSAFFGSFDFTAESETLAKLNSQLKLQTQILRFLLISKEIPKIIATSDQQIKPRKTSDKSKEASKAGGKQLEKELENVLENIDY